MINRRNIARKRTEGALRESEDRSQDLAEQGYDLICTHDLAGRLLSVSQTAARSLGYEREALVGRNIREALLPELREQFDDYIAEIQQEGIAQGLMIVQTRTGERRIWEYTNILRTEGAAAPIVRGVAHDVTEQRRAEKALKASESELRTLFAAMTDAVLVLDAEGRYLKVAPTSHAYLYKPPDELIGKTLHEVFPQAQADIFLAHIRRVLDEGRMQRVEYRLQTNEAEVWFDDSVAPLSKKTVIWIARDITERKRAEEALKVFRNLIDQSSDAIEVIDPSTLRFLDCNESAYQTLGYSRGEFLSLSVQDIDPTVDPARRAWMEEEIEKSGFATFESLHLRKDGSEFPVEVNVKVVRLERDYRLAVVRDITERKRAEQALRQAEEKYRGIFEHAAEGIFQTTPDGQFITANPALARMLGYDSPEELLNGRTDIAQQHYVEPERRSEFKRLLEEHGVVQEFEHQAYRQDGRKIWLSENGRAVRDDSGAVLYYEGFTEDITERKQAEEALRESEERYRDMVENARDIIYSHDLAGNYTSINKAGEQIIGYTREEALKMSLAQTVAPEYLEKARQMLSRKLAGEKVTAYDLEIIAKDGRRITVEVNTHLVYQDGVAVGVQGIARDITKRKRANEILQTFPRRLVEAQEAERRRVARELHDEIGQALTAIKINLQNVQYATDVAPQLDESIMTIDDALQQVRDLSFNLRPSLLDDLGLVAALRWYLDREARRAGLSLEFAASLLETRLPLELETACFRIAQEALTNIVRHAQAKQVRVELRRRGVELHLLIRDDGIGFDVRAARNHRASDMNLGLQGMQERALILGGHLKIKSSPAHGTEIHAWFPLMSFHSEGEKRD